MSYCLEGFSDPSKDLQNMTRRKQGTLKKLENVVVKCTATGKSSTKTCKACCLLRLNEFGATQHVIRVQRRVVKKIVAKRL